jgi:nitrogen fixation-related uncharacterized protein
MLSATTAVLWIGALLGLVTLTGFAWAWSIGHFHQIQAQAWTILDADDLRYDRPWETSAQRQSRTEAYGPLIPPPPGSWGGVQ